MSRGGAHFQHDGRAVGLVYLPPAQVGRTHPCLLRQGDWCALALTCMVRPQARLHSFSAWLLWRKQAISAACQRWTPERSSERKQHALRLTQLAVVCLQHDAGEAEHPGTSGVAVAYTCTITRHAFDVRHWNRSLSQAVSACGDLQTARICGCRQGHHDAGGDGACGSPGTSDLAVACRC